VRAGGGDSSSRNLASATMPHGHRSRPRSDRRGTGASTTIVSRLTGSRSFRTAAAQLDVVLEATDGRVVREIAPRAKRT
jgi:hypothetical protein